MRKAENGKRKTESGKRKTENSRKGLPGPVLTDRDAAPYTEAIGF